MKRRAFLKTAAALLPSTGLQSFALAQASTAATPTSADQIHIVGAGQDRFGETHSRGYSTILFKFAPRETNGSLFIVEHTHLVKGGPPLHLHLHQEEWFYVMEGEVLFQIGEERRHLRAGESVLTPRNTPHTFSSIGQTPGRLLIAFTPVGKMEQFFRDTAIPNPPHEDAEFYSRYEMKLLGPPLTVS
jgi:mannose-6-phosphate isomerase-like protein (cupin superfamily)